jgi:hypothetical protein
MAALLVMKSHLHVAGCHIDLVSCHPLAVNRLAAFLAGHRGERPQILAELRAGGVALPAASCELLDGAAVDQ